MIRVFRIHIPGRTLALALTEGLIIVFALVLATYAQFGKEALVVLTYEHMLTKVLLACLLSMICMHYHDLYQSVVLHSLGAVFTRLLQVLGTMCVLCGLAYYAVPVIAFGYDLVLTWIILAGVGLSVWRIAFFFINRSRRLQQRVLFIGDSPLLTLLFHEIESRPELGLRIVGYPNRDVSNSGIGNLYWLGEQDELAAIVRRDKISRVIFGHTALSNVHRLCGEPRYSGVMVQHAEELYEDIFDKVPVFPTASMLETKREYKIPTSAILFKEVSSVVLAVIGQVLALPVMILIGVAIRLDSAGPIIFRQKRVGRYGQVFTLYKFRSMRHGTDRDGISPPAQRNDSRFTRVGRFIRRTRMDELPQLWNIMRGDMYLIGPRPFTVDTEEDLSRKIPHYIDRWLVKPGVTGWAQIRRPYCSSLEDNIDKLAHDLFYIKNMSISLDLLICFETVKILILGRGAQ